MTRNLLATGLLLVGAATVSAQTITPGIGGVAITGQSGAGVYLPWSGGAVIGAPGVGSYNLGSGGYTSPWSWNQYSNPTAYNFNTGNFNYNSGLYGGWGSNYYGSGYSPYSSGVYQTGYNNYPSSSYYGSGYTYPSYYGNSYYGNSYPSSWSSGYYGGYSSPVIYTNGGGRGRVRFR